MNSLTQFLGAYNSDDEENDVSEKEAANTTTTTNWTKCTDHAVGHPYYWNMETKEVTWEMPTEYHQFLETSKSQFSELPIDDYWKKGEDKNTTFFVNELTRIVTWQKPPGYKEDKISDTIETTVSLCQINIAIFNSL